VIRSVGVHLREALGGLRRDWRSAALALLVVTASALAMAVVLVVSTAADRAVARLADQADLSVFLAAGAPADVRQRVDGLLRRDPSVANAEYVGPDAAAARFRRAFPDLAPLLDDGIELPASFDVRFRPGAGGGASAASLARSLQSVPGVESVRFDRELAERGAALVSVVRRVGLALAVVLALAGGVTVFSIVRLSYVARRDEVEILHLVGAPLATIRGPFVLEGMIQGGAGAVIALGLLAAGTRALEEHLKALSAGALGIELPLALSWGTATPLVLGATALGGVAAWLAVRSSARAFVA
jgi:cell division transport system permease protein